MKKNVLVVSGLIGTDEEVKNYEKIIKKGLLYYEKKERFNISFFHKKIDTNLTEIVDNIDGPFLVLFLKNCNKEQVISLVNSVFKNKNCVSFCYGSIPEEAIKNFNNDLEMFLLIHKKDIKN